MDRANVFNGDPQGMQIRAYETFYNATLGYSEDYFIGCTDDGRMMIGKRRHGTTNWYRRELAGTEASKLQLPITPSPVTAGADAHRWQSLMMDYRGFVHIMGNMHAGFNGYVIQYLRSANAYDMASTFTVPFAGNLPGHTSAGLAGGWTYPQWICFPDGPTDPENPSKKLPGSIRLTMRDVGTGQGNWHQWRIDYNQGNSTLVHKGMLFEGRGYHPFGPSSDNGTNAYPVYFLDDNGSTYGRLWCWFVWRTDSSDHLGCANCTNPTGEVGASIENHQPSVMYSDDRGDTWTSWNGTALSFPTNPIRPDNADGIACRINRGYNHSEAVTYRGTTNGGFFQGGGLAIVNGQPHLMLDTRPSADRIVDDTPYNTGAGSGRIHYWLDPTDTTQSAAGTWKEEILTAGSISGHTITRDFNNLLAYQGELWELVIRDAGGSDREVSIAEITVGGTHRVFGSGMMMVAGSSGILNWEALRRFGSVEVMVMQGDFPQTTYFGGAAGGISSAATGSMFRKMKADLSDSHWNQLAKDQTTAGLIERNDTTNMLRLSSATPGSDTRGGLWRPTNHYWNFDIFGTWDGDESCASGPLLFWTPGATERALFCSYINVGADAWAMGTIGANNAGVNIITVVALAHTAGVDVQWRVRVRGKQASLWVNDAQLITPQTIPTALRQSAAHGLFVTGTAGVDTVKPPVTIMPGYGPL